MKAAVLVAAAALLPAPASAQTFTNVTQESGLQALRDMKAANIWLSGLDFADLDGDGVLDFYFGTHHGEGGLAALNDGRGRFTAAGALPLPGEIHLAQDINEDGRLDFTMTQADTATIWVTNNSKPGALAFARTTYTRNYSRFGALADMDGDGKVDWIVAGGAGRGNDEGVWIVPGDGKGGFVSTMVRSLSLPGLEQDSAEVHAFDADGDGDTDLVVHWNGGTRLYRNDGGTTLTQATDTGLPDS